MLRIFTGGNFFSRVEFWISVMPETPPPQFLWRFFFIITLHEQSPIFTGHFLTKLHKSPTTFSFFHGHFCAFHGWKFSFFSRPPFSVFTGEIWRKISRGLLSFHGQFSRHFHGKVHFFTAGNPKIFTGGKKFFTGKKKH